VEFIMENSTARAPATEGAADRKRRDFLRRAGLAGLVLSVPGVLTSCAKDALAPTAASGALLDRRREGDGGPDQAATVTLNFANEIDVLNYAFALEQLEAAFYVQVIATPYAGITAEEMRLLTDVRDHEVAHRDFFAAALGGAAIPDLTVDFSAVSFNSRRSVLRTAMTFEDLGVGAYNGAARYLSNDRYLIVAGKIVSVEARHAAAIRDLLEPRSDFFAPDAFDTPIAPATVLAAASPFIVETVTATNT
jgi:rubrerythrin